MISTTFLAALAVLIGICLVVVTVARRASIRWIAFIVGIAAVVAYTTLASAAPVIPLPSVPVARVIGWQQIQIGADTYYEDCAQSGDPDCVEHWYTHELLIVHVPPRAAGEYRPRSICVEWGGPLPRHQSPFDVPTGPARCFPEEWVRLHEQLGDPLVSGHVRTKATDYVVVAFPRTQTKRTTFGNAPDMQVRVWWMWTGRDRDGKWVGDPVGGAMERSRVVLHTAIVANLPEYVIPRSR